MSRMAIRVHLFLASCVLAIASMAARAADTAQIPLMPGVVVMFAVVNASGDREPVFTIRSVGADHYEALFTSDIEDARTGAKRTIEIPRRVRMQDHRSAHAIRSEYWEGDPLTFSGTTPFFSRAVIEDLRRGSSTITDQYSGSMFGLPVPGKRRGVLTRVGYEKLAVLVNGRMTELRVIRARGEFRDEASGERKTAEVIALDDLENPLYLQWHEPGVDSRVVRIDYPEPSATRARLEAALAERKPLDVYSVYFAFASATLRPQSKPTLEDIAAVLKKHPEWKLRIEGHTDSIGGDSSNLKLSEQRAAAVREALIRQYGIAPERLTSGGRGKAGAIDTNDTPEGRARNRRVVLTRE